MTPLIRLENLTVAYNRHPAVHHVSGAFASGSLTAIAGPNGAGKSTLLKAIMGELRPAEGRVEHRLGRAEFGYLPQAAEIDRRFPISVIDTVMLGAWKKTGAFGRIAPAEMKRAGEALSAVGLEGFGLAPCRVAFGLASSSACSLPACCCRMLRHYPAR